MIGRSVSTVKSSNSYLSYRQPYLGWRSLERLKLSGQSCLSPEQRLAASLLNQVSPSEVTMTITSAKLLLTVAVCLAKCKFYLKGMIHVLSICMVEL